MNLIWPGCAQGKYILKAKGYILAVLRWGRNDGPLDDWGPFAYVPIDPAGNGCFFFSGMRGIVRGASHVWARCFTPDFSAFEDVAAEIPERFLPDNDAQERMQSFSILTDLHLAAKPWKTKQALRATESPVIFLLGDSTNDAFPEQFAGFRACIEETVPEKIIFPVTGNHDVLRDSCLDGDDGCKNYADFQSHLLAKAERNGYVPSFCPDQRAYSVRSGDLDIIGLQCATAGRRFLFPESTQLDWLEKHLSETPASWHILLCHAPMMKHNPNRNDGPAYLDKNNRLQEILDHSGRIIFLSGHTHVSPNVLTGNGEYDEQHQNIYLDCGSVVATDTSGEAGLMASDWKDGCRTEIWVSRDTVEICMSSVDSGTKFPRGYYRFRVVPKERHKS